MPDAPPPVPVTEAWWTANGRQQVVSQLDFASIAAATEGRVYAVLDRDRLEFDTGAALVPGPNWGTSGRVGVWLTDATNRSIPNNAATFTSLTFGTEVQDTDGFITAPGTTITIPSGRGGLYAGFCTAAWASAPGANSAMQVLHNGATRHRLINSAATNGLIQSIFIIGAIAAGDTIQIQMSQGSGSAINVNPSAIELWRFAA